MPLLTCQHCNASYKASAYQARRGSKYCSRECQLEAFAAKKRKQEEVVCARCGEEFRVPHWQAKTRKYCSPSCMRLAFSKGNTLGDTPHVSEECVQGVYRAIDSLEAEGVRVSVKEIGKRYAAHYRTITRAICALEQRGLIYRGWIATTKRYRKVDG